MLKMPQREASATDTALKNIQLFFPIRMHTNIKFRNFHLGLHLEGANKSAKTKADLKNKAATQETLQLNLQGINFHLGLISPYV